MDVVRTPLSERNRDDNSNNTSGSGTPMQVLPKAKSTQGLRASTRQHSLSPNKRPHVLGDSSNQMQHTPTPAHQQVSITPSPKQRSPFKTASPRSPTLVHRPLVQRARSVPTGLGQSPLASHATPTQRNAGIPMFHAKNHHHNHHHKHHHHHSPSFRKSSNNSNSSPLATPRTPLSEEEEEEVFFGSVISSVEQRRVKKLNGRRRTLLQVYHQGAKASVPGSLLKAQQTRAAEIIQSAWRRYKCHRSFRQALSAVVAIQRWYRQVRQARLAAATKIQRWWRTACVGELCCLQASSLFRNEHSSPASGRFCQPRMFEVPGTGNDSDNEEEEEEEEKQEPVAFLQETLCAHAFTAADVHVLRPQPTKQTAVQQRQHHQQQQQHDTIAPTSEVAQDGISMKCTRVCAVWATKAVLRDFSGVRVTNLDDATCDEHSTTVAMQVDSDTADEATTRAATSADTAQTAVAVATTTTAAALGGDASKRTPTLARKRLNPTSPSACLLDNSIASNSTWLTSTTEPMQGSARPALIRRANTFNLHTRAAQPARKAERLETALVSEDTAPAAATTTAKASPSAPPPTTATTMPDTPVTLPSASSAAPAAPAATLPQGSLLPRPVASASALSAASTLATAASAEHAGDAMLVAKRQLLQRIRSERKRLETELLACTSTPATPTATPTTTSTNNDDINSNSNSNNNSSSNSNHSSVDDIQVNKRVFGQPMSVDESFDGVPSSTSTSSDGRTLSLNRMLQRGRINLLATLQPAVDTAQQRVDTNTGDNNSQSHGNNQRQSIEAATTADNTNNNDNLAVNISVSVDDDSGVMSKDGACETVSPTPIASVRFIPSSPLPLKPVADDCNKENVAPSNNQASHSSGNLRDAIPNSGSAADTATTTVTTTMTSKHPVSVDGASETPAPCIISAAPTLLRRPRALRGSLVRPSARRPSRGNSTRRLGPAAPSTLSSFASTATSASAAAGTEQHQARKPLLLRGGLLARSDGSGKQQRQLLLGKLSTASGSSLNNATTERTPTSTPAATSGTTPSEGGTPAPTTGTSTPHPHRTLRSTALDSKDNDIRFVTKLNTMRNSKYAVVKFVLPDPHDFQAQEEFLRQVDAKESTDESGVDYTRIRWHEHLETTEKSTCPHNTTPTNMRSLLKQRGDNSPFPYGEDLETVEIKVLPRIRPARRGSGVTRRRDAAGLPGDDDASDAAWV